MKHLITALLLLFSSTVFAQVPQPVESDLAEIESLVESIRGYYSAENELPKTVSATYTNNNRVLIEWSSFSTTDSVDIEFYSPEIHSEWQHSVNKYIDLHNEPINLQSGAYLIGGRSDMHDLTWKIRMIVGDWVSEVITLTPEQRGPPEKLDIFTAFWYDNNVPDNELKRLMTSGHHAGPNYAPLKEVQDYGHRVIATVGGFEADMNEFQLRRRLGWRTETFERIGWENIDFIILRDEPFGKGLTKEQLEIIVDEAQKHYKVPVTFMFTKGSVLRRDLPDNLNLIGFNGYPFFRKDAPSGHAQIWSYEEFRDHFNEIFDKLREEYNGDIKVVISPQIFGIKEGITDSPPWRMPTGEELEWYFRYAAETPEIIGFTFWTWGDTPKWRTLESEPELQEALEELLQKWTK